MCMKYIILVCIILFSNKIISAGNVALKNAPKPNHITVDESIEQKAQDFLYPFLLDKMQSSETDIYGTPIHTSGEKDNGINQKFISIATTYKRAIEIPRKIIFKHNSIDINDEFLKKDHKTQKTIVEQYAHNARAYNRFLEKLSSNSYFNYIVKHDKEIAAEVACKGRANLEVCRAIPLEYSAYMEYVKNITSKKEREMVELYKSYMVDSIPYMFKPISVDSDISIINSHLNLDIPVNKKGEHKTPPNAKKSFLSKGKQYFHQAKDGTNKVMKSLKSKWNNRNNKPAQGAQ